MISKELFSLLEWYTINIYIKGKPEITFCTRILRKDYYEVLHFIVKPFIEENEDWIKCFYYSWYYDNSNPYHVKIRVGTNEIFQSIEKELDNFFEKLPRDKRVLLDDKTHALVKEKDITFDKNRYAKIEEGKFDEDAYYWFVMHWQTGSIYFLEVLENGYDNFPQLCAVPYLQWNLMGSIVTQPKHEEEYGIALETKTFGDRRDLKTFNVEIFGKQSFNLKLPSNDE